MSPAFSKRSRTRTSAIVRVSWDNYLSLIARVVSRNFRHESTPNPHLHTRPNRTRLRTRLTHAWNTRRKPTVQIILAALLALPGTCGDSWDNGCTDHSDRSELS